MVSLLGLALLLLALVQTKWFKNYAADKATRYLSKELGVDVHIGEIELSYFDALKATDIYIADQKEDTLIYVSELQTDYDIFSFTSDKIRLNNIKIAGGNINIGVAKEETQLNIRFLTDYFKPAPTGKPSANSPSLIFDKVEIIDTRFHYYNENKAPSTSRAFDENNMIYRNLNGHLHNFTIIKDSLSFLIDKMSGTEKSGLIIEELKAKTIISPTTMEFADLHIQTPQSTIRNFLRFSYASYSDFSDFIKRVVIEANLAESKVHTNDIALFTNSLTAYNELITGNGKITGTIANLESSSLDLKVGNHTTYSGYARLKGLPDINKTYFDLTAKSFNTNTPDLAPLIKLDPAPNEFLNLGQVSYQGTFVGFINDFKIKGDLTSAVGDAAAALHYRQPQNGIARYQGTLRSDNIDLNKLLEIDKVGSTSFDLQVSGKGLTAKILSASISGDIHHIGYSNYDYKNIAVNGTFSENLFQGNGRIIDPNFNFDFDGKVDLNNEKPTIDITTNVVGINLKTLGLDSTDNVVNFRGSIALAGDNLDNLIGKIDLDSFTLNRNNTNYTINNLAITAEETNQSRTYTILSDLLHAEIKGDFIPSDIESILGYIKHIVYPIEFPKPEDTINTKDIQLIVTIPSYDSIYTEFLGETYFDSATIHFTYDHAAGQLISDTRISGFNYDVISTPKIDVTIRNNGSLTPINFTLNTAGLFQNDSTLFDVSNVNGFITDSIVNFDVTAQKDSILDLAVGGRFVYTNDSALVFVESSKVFIYEEAWNLRKSNTPNVIYQNGITELRSFDFRNEEQILYIEASSGFQANKINVILTEFKLDNLTPFLAGFDLKLDGITNGSIDVSDRDGFPIIEANLDIAHLQLDNDTLGNLSLTSENQSLLAVAIKGSISEGLLNDMKILGDIDFQNKVSPLDLHLLTENSSIKPFEKYLNGLASHIKGYTNTDIKITGPLTSPKLVGKMDIDSLSFVVDYLQTAYTGFVKVDIDYNSFTLTDAQLVDRFNNTGRASGKVNHHNFTNFRFDLNIDELENFEIMNTERGDNKLFFGSAFVDGGMKIIGPTDDILLQINAKSRKGTEIFIPLDHIEASGNLSYVEFVNFQEDNNQLNQGLKSEAGVRMDFNFEVTDDASVTLIFDELLGDKIEAAGHGNLRMEINTFGDFSMYGGLIIDRGNYLFTALDLINKYFIVKPGGTLFWDGNPYNAKIDLEAIKREYPIPKTLMSGSAENLEQYNQSIPVDCYLKLSGLLFDPAVSFDLKFPTQTGLSGNASSALNTTIERIKLDPEELNRQVFALLVLGTFVPPSFASGSSYKAEDGVANTGINSLSDFASSQLNNWLGQLDTRVKLGVDYQVSNQSDQAELILSLRRKFLNDRLSFAASVDAASQNQDIRKPYDLNLSYNITEDGRVRINGFQKRTTDPTLGNQSSIQTAGIGLSFRYQFDNFRLRRKKKVSN